MDKYAQYPVEIKQVHFDKLIKYREQLRKEPELTSLFIEMTLQCNEHCRHCGSRCEYTNGDAPLTDFEIIQTLIDLKEDLELVKKPLPFLNITGGEPLLRPNLIPLMNCPLLLPLFLFLLLIKYFFYFISDRHFI